MLGTLRQFGVLLGRLTKRGTPSGSPMLITVCSCFESDEPDNCQFPAKHLSILSSWSFQAATPGVLDPFQCSQAIRQKIIKMGDSLSKLGLRSCPYFVLEEELGVDCCGC